MWLVLAGIALAIAINAYVIGIERGHMLGRRDMSDASNRIGLLIDRKRVRRMVRAQSRLEALAPEVRRLVSGRARTPKEVTVLLRRMQAVLDVPLSDAPDYR